MPRENCPVCGTDKHILNACGNCGWSRSGRGPCVAKPAENPVPTSSRKAFKREFEKFLQLRLKLDLDTQEAAGESLEVAKGGDLTYLNALSKVVDEHYGLTEFIAWVQEFSPLRWKEECKEFYLPRNANKGWGVECGRETGFLSDAFIEKVQNVDTLEAGWEKCGMCGVPVKKLQRHMNRVHGQSGCEVSRQLSESRPKAQEVIRSGNKEEPRVWTLPPQPDKWMPGGTDAHRHWNGGWGIIFVSGGGGPGTGKRR